MDILCPVCHQKLRKDNKRFVCENHHSYDIAKEGYLNLNLKNSQKTGDNPLMIRARKEFLEKGYYDFLRAELSSLIKEDDELVDLACGEGYYTAFFDCKEKIGIDLSKSGLKIASKADKSTTYLLNSIFHNPLSDESADKVVTIFAPVAHEEIRRILKPAGQFILVRPDVYHLYELKEVLYDKPYLNEAAPLEYDGLKLIEERKIQKKSAVGKEDLNRLFMMTPYVNTTSQTDKAKLNKVDELEVTFAFIIDIFEKD